MNYSRTLILNASYEPMKIIDWTRAVCMWLDDKVEIVATYTERVYDAIKDWNGLMPAVVRLKKYIQVRHSKVKFSRINVFSRDNFSCQYCGAQPGTPELTYDHVIPRSRGGKTNWDNIVTSCLPCNSKKSDRTLEQSGMKLKKIPKKPKKVPFFGLRLTPGDTPEEWRDFLYWNQELEST